MKANKIKLNDEVLIDLTQDTAEEADVLFGKTFHKADGSIAVGTAESGAALNIIYGDIAPEDTSKVWVKTSKPSKTIISSLYEHEIVAGDDESIVYDVATSNARFGVTGQRYGDKIYLFNSYSLKNVSCYDILTGLSTALPIEYPYTDSCSCIKGDKIYLFGGLASSTATNEVLCFDCSTETLSSFATLPSAISRASAILVDNYIYIFGGKTGAGASTATNTIYRFDISNGQTELLTISLPYPLFSVGVGLFGNYIYVVGGYGTSYASSSNHIYRFNINDLSISEVTSSLPDIMFDFGYGVIGKWLYIINGRITRSGTKNEDIYRFNMETEAIEKTPLKLLKWRCEQFACVTDDYSLLLFGGNTNSGGITGVDRIDSIGYAPSLGSLNENEVIITPKPLLSDGPKVSLMTTDAIEVKFILDGVYKGVGNGEAERLEAFVYQNGSWVSI